MMYVYGFLVDGEKELGFWVGLSGGLGGLILGIRVIDGGDKGWDGVVRKNEEGGGWNEERGRGER